MKVGLNALGVAVNSPLAAVKVTATGIELPVPFCVKMIDPVVPVVRLVEGSETVRL